MSGKCRMRDGWMRGCVDAWGAWGAWGAWMDVITGIEMATAFEKIWRPTITHLGGMLTDEYNVNYNIC